MKKVFWFISLLAIVSLSNYLSAQTITSIANGNWSSPTTWGGIPPLPGSTVVINHTVILDLDYGYSAGSITINSTGALNGSIPTRGLAVSGGALTVNGSLNISRLALIGGTIINSETMQNDSLYCATSLTNSGTINATQFMINSGGVFVNNGSVFSTNLLNLYTLTNSALITVADLKNSKTFNNTATGYITVTHNFLNSDSLASPAVFTNDGKVMVQHDWRNSKDIGGTGRFCVQDNSNNSGTMSGTFDFCDLSGGGIDLNTGTVSNGITYCLFSCYESISEVSASSICVEPNPNHGLFSITVKEYTSPLTVDVYNTFGKLIRSEKINAGKADFDLSSYSEGIYFYQIKGEKGKVNSGKIVLQ